MENGLTDLEIQALVGSLRISVEILQKNLKLVLTENEKLKAENELLRKAAEGACTTQLEQ